jgi:hypothetical protein
MNSLSGILDQFTLPELSRVLRRSVLVAVFLATVAFIVTLFASWPLASLGISLGLLFGIFNIRLVTSQTARVTSQNPARPVRAMASLTIVRLGALTAVIFGLAVASVQLGIGTVFGVMIFYFSFIGNLVAIAVGHSRTPHAGLPGGAAS